jgi:hypothetical protein
MFLLRAIAVWLVIVLAESVHGTLRALFLAPAVGDFQSRQLSVFTGSLLILLVAYLCIRWIRAVTAGSLIIVGLVWLALTLLFEVSLGRFLLGLSWERLASDYDISRGGLLPFGLLILTLSPLIAARLRGLKTQGSEGRRWQT